MRRNFSFAALLLSLVFGVGCNDEGFRSAKAGISSQCFQKPDSAFKSQKVHVSRDWSEGFRKASAQSDQLVITVDTKCLKLSEEHQSFMGLDIDLDKLNDVLPKQAFAMNFPGIVSQEVLEAAAENNPCVVGVTEQKIVHRTQFQAAASSTNDARAGEQDNLDFANFDQGFPVLANQLNDVVVAVIDTGIDYNHQDLQSRMWQGPQGEYGYNYIANNNLPLDDDGHGTHVAGIIGAQANNGIGIAGVAGLNARLMAVKVLDNTGAGSIDSVYNGILYAAQMGAEVINLSIESPGRSVQIEDGINFAVASGAVVVMATGNQSEEINANNLYAPAYIGKDVVGAIAVASLDSTSGNLSLFSNYSPEYAEIAAAGSENTVLNQGILSTTPNNQYARVMGTSQASPMVAGAVTMLIGYLKNINAAYNPAMVEQSLKARGVRSVSGLAGAVNNGDVLDIGQLAIQTAQIYQVNPPDPDNPPPLPELPATNNSQICASR